MKRMALKLYAGLLGVACAIEPCLFAAKVLTDHNPLIPDNLSDPDRPIKC